jgi:hypothetical protein
MSRVSAIDETQRAGLGKQFRPRRFGAGRMPFVTTFPLHIPAKAPAIARAGKSRRNQAGRPRWALNLHKILNDNNLPNLTIFISRITTWRGL